MSSLRKRTASLLTIAALALALPIAAHGQSDAAGADVPVTAGGARTISVVGNGTAFGEPDVATLQVGAVANDPDVRTAVGEVDRIVEAVMSRLEEMGIAREDMRTVSYNVWREERYPEPPQPQESVQAPVATYRAQHMLLVRLEGAERAGEVLAAAVEAGANSVGGISFELSDPDELESQAREQAVADARRRAEELAHAAGLELGEPLTIQELTQGVPVGGGFERAASVMSLDSAPVAPGQLSVDVRVLIDFRIEAAE